MKVIKINNEVIVVTNEGKTLKRTFSQDEKDLLNIVLTSDDKEEILTIMQPEYLKKIQLYDEQVRIMEQIENSDVLKKEGNILTIPSISKLSVPYDLAIKILEFEENKDEKSLNSYLKFWKLCCLNPSEVTRQNLFWFLNKNGMTITQDGLFVAYRNVVLKHKNFRDLSFIKAITNYALKLKSQGQDLSNFDLWYNSDNNNYYVSHEQIDETVEWLEENGIEEDEFDGIIPVKCKGNMQQLVDDLMEYDENKVVFTDAYSRTTTIELGKPVSIPRSECNDDNLKTCEAGLHVASKIWLQENYFGDVGLICLVNPAKVVAVPINEENYGKMRTCEYFPVAFSERDENGCLKDTDWLENAESMFLEHIFYEGEEGKDSNFTIKEVQNPVENKSVNDLLEEFKKKMI